MTQVSHTDYDLAEARCFLPATATELSAQQVFEVLRVREAIDNPCYESAVTRMVEIYRENQDDPVLLAYLLEKSKSFKVMQPIGDIVRAGGEERAFAAMMDEFAEEAEDEEEMAFLENIQFYSGLSADIVFFPSTLMPSTARLPTLLTQLATETTILRSATYVTTRAYPHAYDEDKSLSKGDKVVLVEGCSITPQVKAVLQAAVDKTGCVVIMRLLVALPVEEDEETCATPTMATPKLAETAAAIEDDAPEGEATPLANPWTSKQVNQEMSSCGSVDWTVEAIRELTKSTSSASSSPDHFADEHPYDNFDVSMRVYYPTRKEEEGQEWDENWDYELGKRKARRGVPVWGKIGGNGGMGLGFGEEVSAGWGFAAGRISKVE